MPENFDGYLPPGVYTKAEFQADSTSFLAGQRIPLLLGVGQEELEQLDIELVRGSSTSVDQQIVDEDVSASWVVDNTNPLNPVLGVQTGLLTTFRVRNYPIVDGSGLGTVTNDSKRVVVTVNGSPVAVSQVQGSRGLVTLSVPTLPTDLVRVTYYMHRGDTAFSDDLSDQVTTTNASLISPGFEPFQIDASSNTFSLKVNGGSAVSVTLVSNPATTAAALKTQIDAAAITGLSTSVFMAPDGSFHLQFTATGSLEILSGSANGPLGFAPGTITSRNRTFRVYNLPITDGQGGGLATTDPSKVVVKVNGTQVLAQSVDGQNGTVTLSAPPAPGSTVTVDYWANTWQDTFDYLPNSLVTSAIRAGVSPGRNDYISGTDYVLENPDASTSVIHWGASRSVSSGLTSTGATPFNDVQISPTLIDDRLYLQECERVVNTSVIPSVLSSKEFLLPAVPTVGNGRDTPLTSTVYNSVANGRQDLISNRPDLVTVYVGHSLRDALTRSPVKVVSVDGASRKITLQNPVPPDYKAFATFWFSRLADDEYILTNKVAGPVNLGTYEVLSVLTGKNLFQVRFGTKTGLGDIVQWPRGNESIPDAYHTGEGSPVNETVTVTFGSSPATSASVTIKGFEPYNFYTPSSGTWVTNLNGSDVSTNLATATIGYLVSEHVPLTGGNLTVPASPGNEFNITVDGVEIDVVVTAGSVTPAAVVAEVNAAIDADPAFSGTAPNNLFSSVTIGTDAVFVLRSYSTPAAIPGGFDHASVAAVRQGTLEGVLGFAAFQSASGSPSAVNKPATILGEIAGPFAITAGLNDTFDIRVEGVDYSITLTAGGAVSAATVVSDINTVVGSSTASVGTLANLNKVRLTSLTNGDGSSLVIVGGSALATLGFNQGDTASQTRVSAQEVVNRLMATASFASAAVAKPVTINGATYVNIETLTTGTGASVGFTSGANSAFNLLSGTGITPGTDGDVGDAAYDNYVVTSTHPSGSTGEGVPGQTFTAAATGLRFTVLPATDGSYTSSGSFTLEVSQTFKVHPTIPTYALGGLETLVSNTVGIGINDTATVKTFNPSGLEPKNGDVYYLSYRFQKQDFTERFFRQFRSLEANFGPVSPENALTLAGFLALQNGAAVVACKQVRKAANSSQASDTAFLDAIDESVVLSGNIRPNILTALTSSVTVQTSLTQHCEVQSNVRNQAERTAFLGFASGVSPSSAQSVARGLKSNRMVAVYPDTAVITLTNELGETFSVAISGVFLAAAVVGSAANPAFDVATPYTRRRIGAIDRLLRNLQPLEANQIAVAGITVIEDLNPVIRIRQGLTTNMDNILTRLPTVTQISDFNNQSLRATLDGYIGLKNLGSRTGEIETSVTALNKSLIQSEILSAVAGLKVRQDTTDPTAIRVGEFIAPVFPLLYIPVDIGVRSRVLFLAS